MSDIIRDALGKLDKLNDADWTAAGLPSVERMRQLTGDETLNRTRISEANPGFGREESEGGIMTNKAKDEGHKGQADFSKDKVTDQDLPGHDKSIENARFIKAEAEGEGLGNPNDAMNNAENRPTEVVDRPDAPEYESETTKLTADLIAKHCDDPIMLLEAASLAAGTGRFARNTPLQGLLRGYRQEQDAIKELQMRIDKRTEDRAAENERANREEEAKAKKADKA